MAEVRQCPKCQQPAMVLVMEWQHVRGSVNTGETTREYRCQSCGKWAVKKAKSRVIALWILGVIFLPACFGVVLLWLAWREQTFDKRVPIVTGVPEPRLRFPGGPPKRTCAKCGGTCKAVSINRHTHNGVPTGTDYEYLCAGCGLRFTTENALGILFSLGSATLLVGVGLAFFFGSKEAGWKYGGGLAGFLFGGFLAWQAVSRVLAALKHKPIEEHVL